MIENILEFSIKVRSAVQKIKLGRLSNIIINHYFVVDPITEIAKNMGSLNFKID